MTSPRIHRFGKFNENAGGITNGVKRPDEKEGATQLNEDSGMKTRELLRKAKRLLTTTLRPQFWIA